MITVSVSIVRSGSSPRGRGKLAHTYKTDPDWGLIPARAGKTKLCDARIEARPAHPRAGGENYADSEEDAIRQGSSPRGRGKPPPKRP